MKHLNLKHSAATLFLLGMITACSTENAVIGNVNVTDIKVISLQDFGVTNRYPP